MLKTVVGPFEFHKTFVQRGIGLTRPNDFTKCCLRLKLKSFAQKSSEEKLENSLAYDLHRDIEVTIGLGERYFDCALDLCLQTMVAGETSIYRIMKVSSMLETVVKDDGQLTTTQKKTLPGSNIKHSDDYISNKSSNETVDDTDSNLGKCKDVLEAIDTNCKSSDCKVDETVTNSSTAAIENSSECNISTDNYIINAVHERDGSAQETVAQDKLDNSAKVTKDKLDNSAESGHSSCFSSYLVIDVTLLSFSPASDAHHLLAEEQLDRAAGLKDIGVRCFKRSDLPTAFYKFSRSLRYLLLCSFDETETQRFDTWNLLRLLTKQIAL